MRDFKVVVARAIVRLISQLTQASPIGILNPLKHMAGATHSLICFILMRTMCTMSHHCYPFSGQKKWEVALWLLLQLPYSFLAERFSSIPLCFYIILSSFHSLPFHLAVSSCLSYLWLALTHFLMNLPFLCFYLWSMLVLFTYLRT